MKRTTTPTQIFNKYKVLLYVILFSTLLFSIYKFLSPNHPQSKSTVKVCISQIINHPALDATRKGIVDGLQQAGYVAGKNMVLETGIAQGKVDTSVQIAQKFVGGKPDVIVGISTPSAQTAALAAKATQIPVVFSSVTYPVQAKLVNSIEKPGGHVTGVSNFTEIRDHFLFFRKLMPNLKRLGLIYNPGEANSAIMVEKSQQTGKELGIEIVLSPAMKTSDVASATLKLVGAVDAVFINNDNTALGAFDIIVKIADRNNLPVFVSDTDMIEQGGLAALGSNQYELGRQTAEMVVRILGGAKSADIPVEFSKIMETKINVAVARKLGITLPPDLMKEAVLVEK